MIGYEISIDFSLKKVQSFSVKTPKSNKKYISIISYSKKIIKILSQKNKRQTNICLPLILIITHSISDLIQIIVPVS